MKRLKYPPYTTTSFLQELCHMEASLNYFTNISLCFFLLNLIQITEHKGNKRTISPQYNATRGSSNGGGSGVGSLSGSAKASKSISGLLVWYK